MNRLQKQQSIWDKLLKSPVYGALQNQQNIMGNLHPIKTVDLKTYYVNYRYIRRGLRRY